MTHAQNLMKLGFAAEEILRLGLSNLKSCKVGVPNAWDLRSVLNFSQVA
jgi:hypothetical protein